MRIDYKYKKLKSYYCEGNSRMNNYLFKRLK